jgi:[ribosomal protein S5]-alanine N-acetyltransferase
VIATRHLVMEPLSRLHSVGMFLLWSDPEVCRFSGPSVDVFGRSISMPARSPSDSDAIIDYFVQARSNGTGFRWALVLAEDGSFVGTLGLNEVGDRSEIAFHMRPAFWGRGLMTEAVDAVLQWLQQDTQCLEVEAFINPQNGSSVRLVRRMGMFPTGEMPTGIFSLFGKSPSLSACVDTSTANEGSERCHYELMHAG